MSTGILLQDPPRTMSAIWSAVSTALHPELGSARAEDQAAQGGGGDLGFDRGSSRCGSKSPVSRRWRSSCALSTNAGGPRCLLLSGSSWKAWRSARTSSIRCAPGSSARVGGTCFTSCARSSGRRRPRACTARLRPHAGRKRLRQFALDDLPGGPARLRGGWQKHLSSKTRKVMRWEMRKFGERGGEVVAAVAAEEIPAALDAVERLLRERWAEKEVYFARDPSFRGLIHEAIPALARTRRRVADSGSRRRRNTGSPRVCCAERLRNGFNGGDDDRLPCIGRSHWVSTCSTSALPRQYGAAAGTTTSCGSAATRKASGTRRRASSRAR